MTLTSLFLRVRHDHSLVLISPKVLQCNKQNVSIFICEEKLSDGDWGPICRNFSHSEMKIWKIPVSNAKLPPHDSGVLSLQK